MSRTTTSVDIESMRLRPVVTSTSVTSASHREDSPGVSSGMTTIGIERPFIASRAPWSISR